jgi:hypothetical protein
MTANKFRALALALPEAIEASHMGHPDFRIHGRIFATLGYPDDNFGMVKLPAEQQGSFIAEAPTVFAPCAGAWGRNGATSVHLKAAKAGDVRAALKEAHDHVASSKKSSSRGRT